MTNPARSRAWPEPSVLSGSCGAPLSEAFFARDTRDVARELLGCLLVSRVDGALTGGRVVETEAYLGTDDAGSHAATRGITPRNQVMYGPPGRAYVYFTYGNHHMLNFVTEPDGTAGAVLVRALEPLVGIEVMEGRRGGRTGLDITNGPGKLTAALGLDLSDNAGRLGEGRVMVYEGTLDPTERMSMSGRVGLSAGHEAQLRFFIETNRYVSRGRTGPPHGLRKSTARRQGGTTG